MDNYGEIIIYQTEDGLTKLDVRMEARRLGAFKIRDIVHYGINRLTSLERNDMIPIVSHF